MVVLATSPLLVVVVAIPVAVVAIVAVVAAAVGWHANEQGRARIKLAKPGEVRLL